MAFLAKAKDEVEGRCPRCGGKILLTDEATGEVFCGICGYVLKERLEEQGPDWRTFTKDEREDRRHAGLPYSLTLHDMGLSTIIAKEDKDASGRAVPANLRSAVSRLRLWDSRSQLHEPVDRNLKQAFIELDALADKLGLSGHVLEQAAYIYRKAVEKGLIRGRSISVIITAALYAACRLTETPRTVKDIAKVSRLPKKEIARAYRLLLKELDLQMPVPDLIRPANRIASAAGLSERVKRRAMEILRKVEEHMASAGKDPMGLAAAALYTASLLEGEIRTQKELAQAAGVTEVTIRNRYKSLRTLLKEINYPGIERLELAQQEAQAKQAAARLAGPALAEP